MNARFSNKVVIVTGGTSGIGLATAKAFADEGAHVFITGRRQAALDAALQQLGDNVTGVRGDMSQLADIDRLYEAVQQRHSHIDVLIANAGGGELAPSARFPRRIITIPSTPTSKAYCLRCRRRCRCCVTVPPWC